MPSSSNVKTCEGVCVAKSKDVCVISMFEGDYRFDGGCEVTRNLSEFLSNQTCSSGLHSPVTRQDGTFVLEFFRMVHKRMPYQSVDDPHDYNQ